MTTSRAVLLCLLLTACKPTAPRPAPQAPDAGGRALEDGIPYRSFATPAEAVAAILAEAKPAVIGFGEVHEKKGSPKVPSAIKRFGTSILPALAAGGSDLIVETWRVDGRCGADEKKVVKAVEKVAHRPETTEDEVLAALLRAKQLGLRPHILSVGCKDYKLLAARDEGGSVDAEALLGMITRHLAGKAEAVLAARGKGHDATRAVVALYGGALHNDLYPVDGLEAFSYAPSVEKKVGERYVEVDLYVPEYIEGDATLARDPWFPVFKRHVSATRTLLLERGERSYILIFPRTRR
jgi:hypothetical protein